MTRIAIIGTAGLPAQYGGFETLAEQLTSELASSFDFSVYCSSPAYGCKRKSHNGANLIYVPLKANGIQSITYDILSMLHAVRSCDVLLILGVSGCIFLPLLRLVSRKAVIVNIDGLEWRRDKWSKIARAFLKLSERCAVRHADAVIADNAAIQEYVAEEYGRRSHLIEYGGDHVRRCEPSAELKEEYPFLDRLYAVTVCRIEPENNIHVILEAFAVNPGIDLVVIGNWDQSAYGRDLLARYARFAAIWLLPPVYERESLDMLRSNAFCYLHGHSAGGTNPSLVEAMHLGLPIAAYDVPYNRETTENAASYFRSPQELTAIVAGYLVSTELEIEGTVMKEIADRRYTWSEIAAGYAALFRSPCPTGVAP